MDSLQSYLPPVKGAIAQVTGYAGSLMTACTWTKHVNRSVSTTLDEIRSAVYAHGFTAAGEGPVDAVYRTAHLTWQSVSAVREWVGTRFVVRSAKILSAYSVYLSAQKVVSEVNLTVRSLKDGAYERTARSSWRVADLGLRIIKGGLSVIRSSQSVIGFEPLSSAYKAYLLPGVDLVSGTCAYVHLRECDDLSRQLRARTDAEAQATVEWLKVKFCPQAQVEPGTEQQDKKLADDGIKDLEAVAGKLALSLVRQLADADKKQEPRISDREVVACVQEALGLHYRGLRLAALASLASLTALAASYVFPDIRLVATGLRTIGIALSTQLLIDRLRSDPVYQVLKKDEVRDLPSAVDQPIGQTPPAIGNLVQQLQPLA